MSEILNTVMSLSVLVFVVTSMLAMGLNLTIAQIKESLRNKSLVLIALIVNFVLVPIVVYAILQVITLETGYAIGLIIMATAAGAPFLPKLAQAAKGDMAFSVGLMVLLMVVTIIYLPIVLPLILQGVEVDALEIAKSLVFMMLVPLGIGLWVKAKKESVAERFQPSMSKLSSLALLLLMISGFLANIEAILGVFGTGVIVAIVLFLFVSLAIGYIGGGPKDNTRKVLGLGTAQRNLAAAFVVAFGNFSDDPNVIVMIMVAGLLGLVVLMGSAKFMGKGE